MTPDEYQERRQNRAIQQHLSTLPEVRRSNLYVTIAFPHTRDGPLRRNKVNGFRELVRSYAKRLSSVLYGRERGYRKRRVTFIAWPEDKDRYGNPTFLHFHCLCEFPLERLQDLELRTKEYWTRAGTRHYGCVPSIDIRNAYKPCGAANYNSKNTESGFTIEYMVTEGLDNTFG